MTHLDTQSRALTLFFSALNWYAIDESVLLATRSMLILSSRSLTEQKVFLERRSSKTILRRMKDDASSLICLRDSTSFSTPRTSCASDTLSSISKQFDFDDDVQSSRVYQVHFRSLIRRTLGKAQSHPRDSPVLEKQVVENEELIGGDEEHMDRNEDHVDANGPQPQPERLNPTSDVLTPDLLHQLLQELGSS